jgi:hypothetical protein
MKVGVMVMTPKASRHQASGKPVVNHGPKNHTGEIECKKILICFFDIQGIVYREFVPRAQTVNQELYLGVLKRLKERMRRTRPGLWRSGEWLIHHDNAPAHAALRIRQFFTS